MGGGMGGGSRGGGMGGRGGPGMGGGSMPSPARMARQNLEKADPIRFLLDHKKPLELTKEQASSFKALRKDMHDAQKPLFKDLEHVFGAMSTRAGGGGGRRGEPGEGPMTAGAPGGGAPDTVRAVIGRLSDIQDSFRDRAREQLTAEQRTRADSLQQVMLAKARATFETQREKRQQRR